MYFAGVFGVGQKKSGFSGDGMNGEAQRFALTGPLSAVERKIFSRQYK